MITSVSNEKIKFVRALQSRRRARLKEGRFVIEGVRLAEEAYQARVPVETVLYVDRLDSRGRGALNGLRQLGAQAEEVSPEVMAASSSTETPSGLMAIVMSPKLSVPSPLTFVLVVDQLADPGNLGTILRTAAAAGVEVVYLAPGTVDAYNPKVVRGAMGAHFRLPIKEVEWSEIETALAGVTASLAVASEGEPYDRVDWSRPAALIVGGEASGASREAERLAARQITIGMPGRIESLNAAVAAGILMFEVVRQRTSE